MLAIKLAEAIVHQTAKSCCLKIQAALPTQRTLLQEAGRDSSSFHFLAVGPAVSQSQAGRNRAIQQIPQQLQRAGCAWLGTLIAPDNLTHSKMKGFYEHRTLEQQSGSKTTHDLL